MSRTTAEDTDNEIAFLRGELRKWQRVAELHEEREKGWIETKMALVALHAEMRKVVDGAEAFCNGDLAIEGLRTLIRKLRQYQK